MKLKLKRHKAHEARPGSVKDVSKTGLPPDGEIDTVPKAKQSQPRSQKKTQYKGADDMWEIVSHRGKPGKREELTSRIEVPGGWLYFHQCISGGKDGDRLWGWPLGFVPEKEKGRV